MGELTEVDWSTLPVLRSPRRAVIADLLDRDRLGRAKLRRRKHKPSKAHGTGRRSAQNAAKKVASIRAKLARIEAARAAYLAAARAYWAGERADHPVMP